MTVHDIVGGAVWIQVLVLMAAIVFAAFETLLSVTGSRRHFLTRRRLSLMACGSVFLVIAILPLLSPWTGSFNLVDALLAQYLKGNIGLFTASEMQAVVNMPRMIVDDLARGTNWIAIGTLALFGAAAIGRLLYLGLNVFRIRRSISTGYVLRETANLRIVASPSTTVPFSTRNLSHYIVVLPADMCGDDAAMRRMALGHELQHIRQGDVDAEILLSLVSPFLILNPGYWFIAGRVRTLAELACDRAFLARDRMAAREYSLRLLQAARAYCADKSSEPTAFGVSLVGRALPLMSRKSMLKARIEEIAADVNAPLREDRLFASVACLCLASLIFLVAMLFGSAGDWSYERIMLSTVVNLERINELNTLAQRTW